MLCAFLFCTSTIDSCITVLRLNCYHLDLYASYHVSNMLRFSWESKVTMYIEEDILFHNSE